MPSPTITGKDGREVSLRVASNWIQWRYPDTDWTNLVPLSDLKGDPGTDGIDGKEVSMRVTSGNLQWRLGATGTWQTLMSVASAAEGATFGGMVVGNKLVLASTSGGGDDHWELIQTTPLVTGTTRYLLGSLTTYKKIRIVVNDKIVQSASGNTRFGVYCGQDYSQVLRRILFPYGHSTYRFGFIETERDDMWWTVLAHGSNNNQTAVASSRVCDVVEWPAGDVQVIVDFSAADAAAFSEGVFFTVYGVKA